MRHFVTIYVQYILYIPYTIWNHTVLLYPLASCSAVNPLNVRAYLARNVPRNSAPANNNAILDLEDINCGIQGFNSCSFINSRKKIMSILGFYVNSMNIWTVGYKYNYFPALFETPDI